MSLKDNFNQAVKELLKRDGLVGSDLSKGSKEKSELDRYLDTPADQADVKDVSPSQLSASLNQEIKAEVIDTPVVEQIPKPSPPPIPQPVRQQAAPQPAFAKSTVTNNTTIGQVPPSIRSSQSTPEPYFETEETTIISRNTIIDGNIRSFANINVEGSIKGDVQITKNANISGKVVGDLDCNNATMLGSSMQGNINSKGQVKLDKDSLILGDIAAQYLDLNGKIKGNVEVGGKAEFKTDAVILGNINANTITVLDGATIQGFVNTTFLQDNAQNLFPEEIGVSE